MQKYYHDKSMVNIDCIEKELFWIQMSYYLNTVKEIFRAGSLIYHIKQKETGKFFKIILISSGPRNLTTTTEAHQVRTYHQMREGHLVINQNDRRFCQRSVYRKLQTRNICIS
ncbi:hypothetical protein RF11_14982 [Thelohanellus kitauei]|uniref:Uncharacterized protein n=1 Tax=Thelohanellus kitauei TaxID=669202 RepID=A0A0C2N2F3_THEKT|nr:hypothetical protein RF11_14982 [Thelohanellus kitauei]